MPTPHIGGHGSRVHTNRRSWNGRIFLGLHRALYIRRECGATWLRHADCRDAMVADPATCRVGSVAGDARLLGFTFHDSDELVAVG